MHAMVLLLWLQVHKFLFTKFVLSRTTLNLQLESDIQFVQLSLRYRAGSADQQVLRVLRQRGGR